MSEVAMKQQKTLGIIVPIVLALFFTMTNCLKPLHIDDSYYWQFARHIAQHPLEPYQFSMMFCDRPVKAGYAKAVVAPPVLLYWWAASIRLVGDNPVLWKALLFPFCFMFAISIHGLLYRFASGWEDILTTCIVVSPTFLPSLNLMVDVPCQALGLFALFIFVRSGEKGGNASAILAGIIAGLSVETKFNGLIYPLVILIYSSCAGKFSRGLISGTVAATVILAWELLLAWKLGVSHMYYHIILEPFPRHKLLEIVQGFASVLGQTSAWIAILGLIACRTSVWACAISLLALIVCEAISFTGTNEDACVVATVMGVALLMVMLFSMGRSWSLRDMTDRGVTGRFLSLWLAAEIAGYFALTPFPAVRRTMGIVVASMMLVGFLLARQPLDRPRRLLTSITVFFGVCLGLFFACIDQFDAESHRALAERSAKQIRATDPNARIWYVGYWGFQFYAENLGFLQIVPARHVSASSERPSITGAWPDDGGVRALEPTSFRKGDYLVYAKSVYMQGFDIPRSSIEKFESVTVPSSIRFTTLPIYGGLRPMLSLKLFRAEAQIYRFKEDAVPLSEDI